MEKPNDVIETREYVEPMTFENDQEAVLFYAYLEAMKYIEYLEIKVNKLNALAVSVNEVEVCVMCNTQKALVCLDCYAKEVFRVDE